MKLTPFLAVAVLCTLPYGTVSDYMSPVTRVAELLQQLAKRVESDMAVEEDMYEKFVCWAKSVVDAKSASNREAQIRIDSLTTYVADLDAGRIELTSERTDLEKELKGLYADIETAEAALKAEHDDLLAAKSEMEQAIAALVEARTVLREGTGGSASLLKIHATLNEGLQARVKSAEALAHAVDVGKRFLTPGDARFLQRVLTGDVPKYDWKKLNRKATFKKKYKARSAEIQDALGSLLQTFKSNLADAEAKEKAAVEVHEKLMKSKGDQKSAAQEALAKMEVEGGARGLSKTEAEAEIAELKTQVKNDELFISQAETAKNTKTKEWTERRKVRLAEIEALNKATAIIRGDDAKDLFKRSLKSQGYDFLQQESSSRLSAAKSVVASVLQSTTGTSGDERLARLVRDVMKAGSNFQKVIAAIKMMISTLQQESDSELADKEKCEADRATDVRSAVKTSRAIDETTDSIAALKSDISELQNQVEAKQQQVMQVQSELDEATKIRAQDNLEWQKSDADDRDALALLKQASEVLKTFYSEHALTSLLQAKQAPEIVAGKAPPPPPATWDGPYTGKQEESKGVIGILSLLEEDVRADRELASKEEKNSQATFAKFKADSDKQIQTLNEMITTLLATKATKEGEGQTQEADRNSKKSDLKIVMKRIRDATPGCDFILVNFKVRQNNRNIEIDGLQKAKGILQGAKFSDSSTVS